MSAPVIQRLEARRILFADDDQQLRDLLTDLLKEAGFEVDAANNGVDALNLIKDSERDYDVLVTDNDMPGLDGLGLVRMVREERFPGKIIVMSAGLSPANVAAYTALEVHRILAKPVNSGVLIGAIEDS
jgi:CheY-like chemotaxis protein